MASYQRREEALLGAIADHAAKGYHLEAKSDFQAVMVSRPKGLDGGILFLIFLLTGGLGLLLVPFFTGGEFISLVLTAEENGDVTVQRPGRSAKAYRDPLLAAAAAITGVGAATVALTFFVHPVVTPLALLAGAAAFIRWQNRCADNAEATTGRPPKVSTFTAGLAWFCPGACLIVPQTGVAETAHRSAPEDPGAKTAATVLAVCWAVAWSTTMALTAAELHHWLRRDQWPSEPGAAMAMVAGFLCFLLIYMVTKDQLQRARNAPANTTAPTLPGNPC